ncbi:MAG: prephenate dehydrogenase [bacterium]
MHVAIIGIGLIGGSVARDLRRTGFATRLTGVGSTPARAEIALKLGLVDRVTTLETAVREADLVVLAIPVDRIVKLLPQVLDLTDRQTVTDMGSTKQDIADAVRNHPRRSRYVASHPMAGTENAGPAAAQDRLFEGKVAVLCDLADSAPDALQTVESLYAMLGMRLVRMNAATHDLHAAYVSHLSHVVSYALALATLEKEKDDNDIFALAGGGFASAARLAKSAPEMWVPIFRQNRAAILDAIDTYQQKLLALRAAIDAGDDSRMRDLIAEANRIRRILP